MTIFSLYATLFDNRTMAKLDDDSWDLPEDDNFFRKSVADKPILMGHNTFKARARPLIGTTNFVLTMKDQPLHNAISLTNAKYLFHWIKEPEEVVLVGGQSIFEQSLNNVTKMYIMQIHYEFDGLKFPTLKGANWELLESVEGEFWHAFMLTNYTFSTYIRK